MTGSYGEFAYLYDSLMDEFDYKAWAGYYQELMARAGLSGKLNICDAACGTASMGLELSRLGHKVVCVDRSPDMLQVASDKARKRGTAITLVEQDIRSLAFHRPLDAVVCACDGVNYLLTDGDVRAFVNAARGALRQGGGLFFDISSEYKLSEHIGSRFFGEEREDVVYLWQNSYNARKALLTMSITFFAKSGALYRRFDEVHTQRAHNVEVLRKLLDDCGFDVIGVYGEQTFLPPNENDLRIHFAAIKRL